MAVITIEVNQEELRVDVTASGDADFVDWMMAAEFLLQKTAQLSSAGFEKALELLVQGAMDYRTILQE